jgi:chromosome segregation ATPase
MASETDNALTTTPSTQGQPGPAPFWVWLLVLVLVALTVYAGYFALSKRQLYYDGEATRRTLAMDKARLSSSLSELRQQLEQAGAARAETDAAMQKLRETADAAAAQVADLQSQVSANEDKIKSLRDEASAARETAKQATAAKAAQESDAAGAKDAAKQATAAKAALESEVEGLKGRLNEIQSKLDSALKDLTSAQEESQSQGPAQ